MDPIPKQQPSEIPPSYETEDAKHWFRLNYEDVRKVLSSLECLNARGSQVIGYRYVNTQSFNIAGTEDSPLNFEATEIPVLIESIGDIGMGEEFPNNFKVALALQVDERNRMIIQYECDAQPNVCDDCEPTHEDDSHGCGHEMDSIDASYDVHHGSISDHTVQDALAFL